LTLTRKSSRLLNILVYNSPDFFEGTARSGSRSKIYITAVPPTSQFLSPNWCHRRHRFSSPNVLLSRVRSWGIRSRSVGYAKSTPKQTEQQRHSQSPKYYLFQWGRSFGLWFLLKNLDTRLIQHKTIICRFTHLPTDRPWCKRSRHPHREISLCLRQLLPNLGLHGYRDNLTVAIKLKGLPAILECLGFGDFVGFNGEF
jgi:hypothetical protein